MPPTAVANKKKDPFLDALDAPSEAGASRPRTRTPTTGTRTDGDARRRSGKSGGARRAAPSLSWRDLPVPIQAAVLFAAGIGLSLLVTPLIGRVVFGPGGLDNIMLTFASESGVSALMMASTAPLLAAIFAVIVYFRARQRVQTIAQSVSRALLVVLLTWMSFGAWATKLWCLPEAYAACYSTVLVVAGLLGGGPVLAAGLGCGYLLGKLIVARRGATLAD